MSLTAWPSRKQLQARRSPNKRQRPIEGNDVASFKDPSYQDRVASAQKAKQKALDNLRAKPPVDEVLLAMQRKSRDAREKSLSDERAAKSEAAAAEKAEKAALKLAKSEEESAAAALKTARLKPASAADMKAARDARYAARKAR